MISTFYLRSWFWKRCDGCHQLCFCWLLRSVPALVPLRNLTVMLAQLIAGVRNKSKRRCLVLTNPLTLIIRLITISRYVTNDLRWSDSGSVLKMALQRLLCVVPLWKCVTSIKPVKLYRNTTENKSGNGGLTGSKPPPDAHSQICKLSQTLFLEELSSFCWGQGWFRWKGQWQQHICPYQFMYE